MAIDINQLLKRPILIVRDDEGYFFNGGNVPPRHELLKCKELFDRWLNCSDKEIEAWNIECDEYHRNKAVEQSNSVQKKNKDLLPGYIYIYKQGEYYKIGRSKTSDCRIKKYVTENPNEIELVYKVKVDDYIDEEKKLHNLFSEKLHNREWFKLTDDDIQQVKKLYATYF